MLLRRAARVGLAACLLAPAQALAEPVVVSGPVAPAIAAGGGLCSASAVSRSPAQSFGTLTKGTYDSGINAFLETHAGDRVEKVVGTAFDLSNNNASGLKLSRGDFTDAEPACPSAGCGFVVNDATTSFAARYRGYFNVTSALAGVPVHFGFYADDAVSLQFFDKTGAAHPVVTRPPQLGVATWRVTNAVTFTEPGLYPVEVLYVEISEHAALEMSYFVGTFSDFEAPASSPPSTNLKNAGFSLAKAAQFSQTLSGSPSFVDPNACKQCDRKSANKAGNTGCAEGSYCNDAALCAPCDNASFCGASCAPCGAATPFCLTTSPSPQCVQCRDDQDCSGGSHCDASVHACFECVVSSDCPGGQTCVDHSCSSAGGAGGGGAGGSAGEGGASGSASAGSAGEGGASGEGGSAGEAGSAGQAGASGEGGSAGEAGASGEGGSAGDAGSSGEGGSAGEGGGKAGAGGAGAGGTSGGTAGASGGAAGQGAAGQASGAAGAAGAPSGGASGKGGKGGSAASGGAAGGGGSAGQAGGAGKGGASGGIAGAGAATDASSGDDGGCGCRTTGRAGQGAGWLVALVAMLAARRGRRSNAGKA